MARFRGTGAKLGKEWNKILSVSLALTANGTTVAAALNFATAVTVLRMLGHYVISRTGAISAADQVKIALGIGVASTDGFTAGAVPDPAEEPEYPWLFWAEHFFNYPAALATSGAGSTDSETGLIRESFDIRSMCRIKPRELLFFAVQYVDLAGTPPMTVQLSQTRVLVGLH